MANYIKLSKIEQLKHALKKSVDDRTYYDLMSDYDVQAINRLTGEVGVAEICKETPNVIVFTVTNERHQSYRVPRAEFNKYFELKLNCEMKKLNNNTNSKKDFVVCVVCRNKTFEQLEVETHQDKPYTCHDCVEQYEYTY